MLLHIIIIASILQILNDESQPVRLNKGLAGFLSGINFIKGGIRKKMEINFNFWVWHEATYKPQPHVFFKVIILKK